MNEPMKLNKHVKKITILIFILLHFSFISAQNAGTDQTGCTNTYTLAANYPSEGTGKWSVISGTATFSNNTLYNTEVVVGYGDNTLRWSITIGETTTFDDVTISNDLSSAANTGSDQTICTNTTIISAERPSRGTGEWTIVGGGGTISNTTCQDFTCSVFVSNLAPSYNTFRWSVTNQGCVTFDEVTVYNNSVYANAGSNIDNICGVEPRVSNATLNAVPPNTFISESGMWTTISSSGSISSPSVYNSEISGMDNGENIFRWTLSRTVNSVTCTDADDVSVFVSIPTTATTISDFEVCDNTGTLMANTPINGTGSWTLISGGGSIANNEAIVTTVTNLNLNENVFRWSISLNGCILSDDILVTNNSVSANAGSDESTACTNFTTLSGNDPAIYQANGAWTYLGGGTINNISAFNANVTNLDIGSNNFTWTITNESCSDSDNLVITNNLPENEAIVDVYSGCQSVFTIGAQQPTATGSGQWTVLVGGASFANKTLYSTEVTVDRGANIIRWTITDNGCSASKDFTLINNLTNPQAGEDVTVCVNEVSLAAADPVTGNGVWTILGGASTEIFDNASIFNATVTNLRKGNITFIWTVSNVNCSGFDIVEVTNYEPVVDAGNDRTICEDYITLAGSNSPHEPNTIGLWTNEGLTGTIINETKYNTQVINLENGANVYRWTVRNQHCSSSDEVIITRSNIEIDAGVDLTVCDDIVNLNAVTPHTGTWVRVNGGATFDNASVYNTTARNLSPYNRFRWNVTANGCTNYDEIEIFSTLPDYANTEIDKAICQANTNITASSPDYASGETGLWTAVSSSATIVTPTNRNTEINGLDSGPNTFRWTISSNGSPNCTTWNNITITNNQVFADAGADQRLCSTAANMNASGTGANSGIWTIVGGSDAIIVNSTDNATTVSNLDPWSNIFKWTVTGGGCTAEDEVVLHNDIPTRPDAGVDRIACDNSSALSANNPYPNRGTGLWKLESGSGVISNNSYFRSSVSGLSLGNNTFSWTITLNNCSLRDDIDIYYNSFNVNAGINQTICSDEYQLTGNDPGTANGYWSVVGGIGIFDNTSLYNTRVSGLAKGYNTLRWSIDDGVCTNYDEVTIMNNLTDQPVAEGDKDVCTDLATIGVNPAPIYLYNESGIWIRTAGAGTIVDVTATNTVVNELGLGNNTFQWTVTKSTNGVDCSFSDEITITNNSVTAYTSSDKEVCGTTSTLSANNPGAGVGTWTRLYGSGIIAVSNDYNTTVSNLSTGENMFRWTIVNNLCTDFADVIITNNQYITNASPGGPSVLCANYSEVIAHIPPVGTTGRWSMFAGIGTFDDETSNTTYVRNLGQGANRIHWTISKDGCNTYTEFDITNNLVITSAGSDRMICENSTNLNASAPPTGGTGFWTKLSGLGIIANTASSTTSVSNLSSGANIFRWLVERNGCSDSDDIVISNNNFFVSAGSNDVTCGTSYTLTGDDHTPGTGLWTIEGGNGVFVDPTNNATIVNGLSNHANIFRWTVTKNGCTFSEIVTITNDLFIADAGGDQSVCSNSAYLDTKNPIMGEGTGLWTVVGGSGTFTNATDGATQLTNLGTGDNILRWTITKEGCLDYDDVVISNNRVIASAGSNQTTCDDFVNLSGSMSATATGLWSGGIPSTVIVNPTSPVTQVTGIGSGNNTFTWVVTDKGCMEYYTVKIRSNRFDAYAGSNQIVTVNSATLGAQLPDVTATGFWQLVSGNGNIADIANPIEPITNLGFGVNTFRWTVDWNNCTATDDADVIYAATSADAGIDGITCEDYYQLDAVVPTIGTGLWTLITGDGVFDDIYDPKTTVRGFAEESVNTYRWTVTINGYSVFDDVIIINNNFTITAGADFNSCGLEATLNAENAGAEGFGVWTIVSGTGTFENSSLANTVVSDITEGENVYTWTVNRNNCINSDNIKLTYQEYPVVSFTATPTSQTYPNATVNIENLSNAGYEFYNWDYGDGNTRLDNERVENFSHTYNAFGQYEITLIAGSNNCTETASQTVEIIDPATGIEKLSEKGIKIYPNPSNGIFNIEFDNNALPDELTITSLIGQKVYHKTKPNSTEAINLSKNGSGVYIINIRKGNELIITKVIVNK